ncbi:alpha-amylase family glycosyl hydrolase [Pseudogemmobacter sp. W21_MBD1_M6]|uniref:alpha-amylase family glycosyl hydrolase n=1 Tax=Pseudogemmobacter sp. W21_MBD1_M6 TaxID=3240271 RepID=UPI003F9B472B
MAEWWRGAIIYQIYPRSFQDDDGDGIGDLAGITRRLGHVANLGADAIWLSPIFTSPMADMGYDVSDYTDIDPLFGTLADFDALIDRAHDLGLKVIVDQVLSHTSIKHPWFDNSRASRSGDKSDWYVWADPLPDGSPPNNWVSHFGGSAWQWDTRRRQYYLHNFAVAQPDLNFHCAEVQDALLDVMAFWLDRGIDGFRLDTVNYYFHDRALRSNPPEPRKEVLPPVTTYEMQDQIYSKTRPENLAFLERIRALTDRYDDRMLVGEVGEARRSLEVMAAYTNGDDRLHMAYSFEMLGPDFTARHFRSRIEGFFATAPGGWPSWSFSNHDVPRHVTRWQDHAVDHDSMARLASAMLLSFEGTIGLYQAEELGQLETEMEFFEVTDPVAFAFWPDNKGRDGCRTPMVWDSEKKEGGFSSAKPWLPVKAPQLAQSVQAQDGVAGSVLEHYRAMIAFRHATPALMAGRTRFADLPEPVLAFRRGQGADAVLCVFNLSKVAQAVDIGADYTLTGPQQAASVSGHVLELGGNGFAFVKGGAPDALFAKIK